MNLSVFTVVNNSYDLLKPTKWPATCFHDGTVAPAPGWTMVELPELAGKDPVTSSRSLKILSHRCFPRAEYSLYIDGCITLLHPPEEFATDVLAKCDIAAFKHPQRDCIYDEASACIRLGKQVDPQRVVEQVEDYRREGFPEHFGLHACAVIVRRHTSEVRRFNELWFQVFLKYGGGWGDQLSFDYARWRLGTEFDEIPGNILTAQNRFVRRRKHARLAHHSRKGTAKRRA